MATILLSGASGFIGARLRASLAADGHRVVRLTRPGAMAAGGTNQVRWDPEAGQIDQGQLRTALPDIVVNLAGEPIAQRWTSSRKKKMRESRVRGTAALAQALARLEPPPRVLVSGSAIGYYGARRGDEALDEDSLPGSDFLAQLSGDWESATAPASDAGIRVAIARTGIVLGSGGGALARMLLPFRLGLGGRIGDGKQWMSWISLYDMVRALRFLADTAAMRGAVNLVAPEPVRNAVFAKTLGRVLHRPALIPVPAFVLELLFGSMADHTILASQHVVSKRLAAAGFEFRQPRLEDALRDAVRR